MNGFKTPLGQGIAANALNCTLLDAVTYTHDIFLRAATERLNVYMLCGSLADGLRDEAFKAAECASFAELVKAVLVKGKNVSIYVWGDPSEERISTSFLDLLREFSEPKDGFGVLRVLALGAARDSKVLALSVSHFLIAMGYSDILQESRCYIRVEQPHAPFSNEILLDLETPAEAALFFNTEQAVIYARRASEVLSNLFNAANERLEDLQTDLKAIESHPAICPDAASVQSRLKERVDLIYHVNEPAKELTPRRATTTLRCPNNVNEPAKEMGQRQKIPRATG